MNNLEHVKLLEETAELIKEILLVQIGQMVFCCCCDAESEYGKELVHEEDCRAIRILKRLEEKCNVSVKGGDTP